METFYQLCNSYIVQGQTFCLDKPVRQGRNTGKSHSGETVFSGISLAGQAKSIVTKFDRFGNSLIQVYLVFVYFLVFKFFQVQLFSMWSFKLSHVLRGRFLKLLLVSSSYLGIKNSHHGSQNLSQGVPAKPR